MAEYYVRMFSIPGLMVDGGLLLRGDVVGTMSSSPFSISSSSSSPTPQAFSPPRPICAVQGPCYSIKTAKKLKIALMG